MTFIPKEGDVIKILPFIDKEGKFTPYIEFEMTWVDKNRIYDITGNLRKIKYKLFQTGSTKNSMISTFWAFNCCINGEVGVIKVGKTLKDIILNSKRSLFDVRSNAHLIIKEDKIKSAIGPLIDYSKSYVDNIDSTPPVEDINSKEEWWKFIKSSKFDFFKYISDNSILVHSKILVDYFGADVMSDIIADIIAEQRERKIKEILE